MKRRALNLDTLGKATYVVRRNITLNNMVDWSLFLLFNPPED